MKGILRVFVVAAVLGVSIVSLPELQASVLPLWESQKVSIELNGAEGVRIRVVLEKKSDVVVSILRSGGESIRTLSREPKEAGSHVFYWNGTDDRGIEVPAGSYVVNVQINGAPIYREGFMLSGPSVGQTPPSGQTTGGGL